MAAGPRAQGRPEARAMGAALLRWFRTHRRPLPWRSSRDSYRLWVAEVLLQQTRVAQAVPYYERVLAAFPDLRALAAADESRVLKVWEGAGYYARARRLRAAARVVVERHGAAIPATVEELEELPGVGPYIARAIAAMAFGVPVVALEANGLRVAARWSGETGDVRRRPVRDHLEARLEGMLPPHRAGPFNEAVMELGETVCLPTSPRCPACPVARWCRAFRELDDPGLLPVRPDRRARPHVRAAVVVVERRGRWLLQRRPPEGLLGGLWEFPGGKLRPGEPPLDAARRELVEEVGLRARRLEPLGRIRHGYSHFTVDLHVYRYRTGASIRTTATRGWFTPDEVRGLPLPRATLKIVERLLRPAAVPAR